ncbi:hypothetical protein [Methanobrevibacter sp.]|uniref:hypothetical protein n=1 Tax=Methanobrevibacter sp. TaxID=66852 RepID=UPI00388D0252
MKLDSKILGVLMAALAVVVVISAVSAVDLANDFKYGDFAVSVPSGTSFDENVNIGVSDMNLTILVNSGKNSKDVNSITYFKDVSSDKKEIAGFIKDLENQGKKVNETDKYVVLKNTHKSHDINIETDLDGIFNIANDVFSGDGLSVSSEGSSLSLSGKGVEVSDANGEGISISSDGININGNSSSENVTANVTEDLKSNFESSDYSVYLKNNDGSQVVVISGNNLEQLKSMAETVSFKGN